MEVDRDTLYGGTEEGYTGSNDIVFVRMEIGSVCPPLVFSTRVLVPLMKCQSTCGD
jgi:hypothetical protein